MTLVDGLLARGFRIISEKVQQSLLGSRASVCLSVAAKTVISLIDEESLELVSRAVRSFEITRLPRAPGSGLSIGSLVDRHQRTCSTQARYESLLDRVDIGVVVGGGARIRRVGHVRLWRVMVDWPGVSRSSVRKLCSAFWASVRLSAAAETWGGAGGEGDDGRV